MEKRTVEEKIERIQNEGCSLPQVELRQKILKGYMGASLDKKSENLFITGCHSTYSISFLEKVVALLRHFGVDYTFLSYEHCCGNSFLEELRGLSEEEKTGYYAKASFFEEKNLQKAYELGAKNLITVCAGCNTRYNQFKKGSINVYHYTQFFSNIIPPLHLEKEVDFYEGCHKNHRVGDFKIDTTASLKLMKRVGGLKVNQVPNLCCRAEEQARKIFERCKTKEMITPTSCCAGIIKRFASKEGIKVRSLPDLLLEAVETRA